MKPTHEISVACISTQPPNKEPCVPATFPLHQGTMLFCSTATAFEWFGWRVPWKIRRYTITSSKMGSLGWWFGFLGSPDTWGSQVSQTTNPKNLSSFSGRSQIGSISPFEGKLGRTCRAWKTHQWQVNLQCIERCLPLDCQCCTAFNFVGILQVVYETFTLLLSISCDVLIDISLATKATCYVILLYHNPMSIFAKNVLAASAPCWNLIRSLNDSMYLNVL